MAKELSGIVWVSRFPDTRTTSELAGAFRSGCEAFIAAARAGGADVEVSSTRRPKERAQLMHFSWRIHKQTLNPQNVPSLPGINIEWAHRRADGSVNLAASRAAATAMVKAYDIAFQPSLTSLHVAGKAIDMTISWSGSLSVAEKSGKVRVIASTPRSGMNLDFRKVGKTYGVLKHPTDRPHWSTTGH
jgi:hypothetical protein